MLSNPQQHLGCADVHIHTQASDGLASTQQVLDYVQAGSKLDVIAITDHDVLDAELMGDTASVSITVLTSSLAWKSPPWKVTFWRCGLTDPYQKDCPFGKRQPPSTSRAA